MEAGYLKSKHDAGLDYVEYMATDVEKAGNWEKIEGEVGLTELQRELLGGFSREMKVLVVSGIWCGDCVQQGPLLKVIAEASEFIDMKWVDRDEHIDLSRQVMVNKGLRVPMVIFMAEDYERVSVVGDRTLSRYRAMAERNLGIACPMPGAKVGGEQIALELADWIDEFERVHLLLRLSARFREKYGD